MMDDNILVGFTGIVVSLLFSYVPSLRDWLDKQTGQTKGLIMLGIMALVAIAVYLAACYTPWVAVECSDAGIQQLVELFIAGMITNQITYATVSQPYNKKVAADKLEAEEWNQGWSGE